MLPHFVLLVDQEAQIRARLTGAKQYKAGVAVQTLYATFGSKQGILVALVDTIREQTDAPAIWAAIAMSPLSAAYKTSGE